MFDIGWTELVVIAVVAIVVIGPKDLPRAMRYVGQWTTRLKRMSREFQGQFNEALREAELDEVKKDIQDIGAGLRADVTKTGDTIRQGLDVKEPTAPVATPAPPAAPDPAPAVKETP